MSCPECELKTGHKYACPLTPRHKPEQMLLDLPPLLWFDSQEALDSMLELITDTETGNPPVRPR